MLEIFGLRGGRVLNEGNDTENNQKYVDIESLESNGHHKYNFGMEHIRWILVLLITPSFLCGEISKASTLS